MFNENELQLAKKELKSFLSKWKYPVIKLSELRESEIFRKYGEYYILYALSDLLDEGLIEVENIYRDHEGHVLRKERDGFYCEECVSYIDPFFVYKTIRIKIKDLKEENINVS